MHSNLKFYIFCVPSNTWPDKKLPLHNLFEANSTNWNLRQGKKNKKKNTVKHKKSYSFNSLTPAFYEHEKN